MKKEEFAKLLDGRELGHEMTTRFEEIANESDLLVCYPDDNDLLIWRGLFTDETANYEGGSAYIIQRKNNVLGAICDVTYDDLLESANHANIEINIPKIEIIVQHNPEETSAEWRVVPFGVPYANFQIFRINGGLFCNGVVIEKDDIIKELRRKTGVELIAEERQKQINKYGFTGEHHANHPEWYADGQLVYAAAALASDDPRGYVVPTNWDASWWNRMVVHDLDERLAIAGALLAAEIDRWKCINMPGLSRIYIDN